MVEEAPPQEEVLALTVDTLRRELLCEIHLHNP